MCISEEKIPNVPSVRGDRHNVTATPSHISKNRVRSILALLFQSIPSRLGVGFYRWTCSLKAPSQLENSVLWHIARFQPNKRSQKPSIHPANESMNFVICVDDDNQTVKWQCNDRHIRTLTSPKVFLHCHFSEFSIHARKQYQGY